MSAAPLPPQPPNRLLIVRLGAMGDIIHTLPAVAILREAFLDAQIGWVVEERWAELLCAKDSPRSGPRTPERPLIDFVHTVQTKAWRKSLLSRETRRQFSAAFHEIREQHYDITVDLQGAIKSAVIARWSGARRTIGMRHPREAPARLFYARQVDAAGAHVIQQYQSIAEAVAKEFAGKEISGQQKIKTVEFPDDHTAELSVTQMLGDTNGQFVVINPGAGWGAKQWPPSRYGEVARELAGDGLTPIINFGPGEQDLARDAEMASGGNARMISCSLGELVALIRRARLFIGGDTGPLHLAAALGVPVVAIFGPTDPSRTGPYGTRSIVLRKPESRTSLSHTSEIDPGLLRISVKEVISAARRLLEETHA